MLDRKQRRSAKATLTWAGAEAGDQPWPKRPSVSPKPSRGAKPPRKIAARSKAAALSEVTVSPLRQANCGPPGPCVGHCDRDDCGGQIVAAVTADDCSERIAMGRPDGDSIGHG